MSSIHFTLYRYGVAHNFLKKIRKNNVVSTLQWTLSSDSKKDKSYYHNENIREKIDCSKPEKHFSRPSDYINTKITSDVHIV